MSSGNWGPNHRDSLEFLGWFAGIIHMTDPLLAQGNWVLIQKALAEYIQQGVTPSLLVATHNVCIDRHLIMGKTVKAGGRWILAADMRVGNAPKYNPEEDGDVYSGVTHNIDRPRMPQRDAIQIDLRFTKAKSIDHLQVKMIRRGWSMLRATRVMRRDGHKVRSWHATADAFLALMLLGRTAKAYDLITSRWSNCNWTANDL